MTLALFESADKDNSGSITFEELKEELENFPEVMENLTIRSDSARVENLEALLAHPECDLLLNYNEVLHLLMNQ